MHAGFELYVTLTNTVPFFIAYLTAFTDRNDRLNFRKDIFNLDEKLAFPLLSGSGSY
jgi:murein L,D-transpeptidase YcbB/YkuD